MACHQGDPRGRTRARPGHRHHQLAAALPQVTPEPARSHALRGNAAPDAPRPGFTPCAMVTQSVTGCITTQSVGTINGVPSRRSPWPNANKTRPPTPPVCRRSTPSTPRACSFPRSAWEQSMACHQGDPRGRTRTRPGHRHHQFAAALPQVTQPRPTPQNLVGVGLPAMAV